MEEGILVLQKYSRSTPKVPNMAYRPDVACGATASLLVGYQKLGVWPAAEFRAPGPC